MTANHVQESRWTRETRTAAATNPTSSQWLLRNDASNHTEASTSAAVAPSVRRPGRTTSTIASRPMTAETTSSAVDAPYSADREDGALPARCAMTATPNIRANQRHGSTIAPRVRDRRWDSVAGWVTDLLCPAAGSLDGF